MYEHIQYEVSDPVAVITLNRPEALNAITGRMQAELKHALATAEQDAAVVGIVLTGAGRGFCAGADIGGLQATASGEAGGQQREDLSQFSARPGNPDMGEDFAVTFSYIPTIRKPLIAAINGACAGLGFVFACLCDMRFVEKQPNATWSMVAPGEYGFYSNVNNQVHHPRWSQASERRIGEFMRRPTLMFNGYEEDVAYLYKNMDLNKYY